MKRVNLYLFFDVPKELPDEDIVEWIEFITGQNGSISNTNKLIDYESNDLDTPMKAIFRLEINGIRVN